MALCHFCRKRFKNGQAVRAHLRFCDAYQGREERTFRSSERILASGKGSGEGVWRRGSEPIGIEPIGIVPKGTSLRRPSLSGDDLTSQMREILRKEGLFQELWHFQGVLRRRDLTPLQKVEAFQRWEEVLDELTKLE